MRRRFTQILFSSLVLACVVAAAGCGGSKKSETTSTTTTTTTTTTTAAAATTTSGSATTSPTTTGAAGGLGALASNCKQLQSLGTSFAKAMQGANGDVEKESALLKQFADQTPSAIRPDFETLADAFSKVAGALKGVNLSSGKTPDASTLAKLSQLATQLQGAKVQAALSNIETWAKNGCQS